MRLSTLFGKTLRQPPAEAEIASHRLILRAALARPLAAGVYSYLPLGWRVIRKIEAIMRDEMDKIGGQEIHMPVLNPAELWKETGRYFAIGPELIRFEDRAERDFVLAMTHEEVVTDLARRELRSYRQLPFMVYQIQTKIRDEARPRGGLIRMREFLMKDGYSFHEDQKGLDEYYPLIHQAYKNIYSRCGLQVLDVEADTGMMGGTGSHEFILLSESGEDTVVICRNCGYAANVEAAKALKSDRVGQHAPPEAMKPVEEASTPGVKTIQQLTEFFSLPAQDFLKSVFYSAGGDLVAVVIRGDLDVNEAKLARALQSADFRFATDVEIAKAGGVPGFASPIGLKNVRVVLDDSVDADAFIAGANKPDTHLRNVHYPRDFKADIVADVALAQAGQTCCACGHEIELSRGVELGHIFKLGYKYSEAMGAKFLSPEGKEVIVIMGCYGIGVDRLLAAIIEQNHDDKGIIWPRSVAPFQVHLVALGVEDAEVAGVAEKLYLDLQARGCEVLYDDRAETTGVKFNDADLIGLPLRATVSRRTLDKGSIEIKPRTSQDFTLVKLDEAVEHIAGECL
ncbi:MAG: proline--tRNA ligase [Chloroflexi bacterium]|nr:proline--tRNA ligase [Chloroflexota bacterium]MDA8189182.1 proline--tRNA ligase [Dehalococcoidales bacterium]